MNSNDRQHMRLHLAARLSTRKTAEGDVGITTQDKRGHAWAEREGHTIVSTSADYKTGTVPPWERKDLKRFVTHPALMQTYDGILAYKLDRLTRGDWDDESRIRQWASENGKVLVVVDGPQWPPRNEGDFWSWTALARQARVEWEDIRERTGRNRRELIETGNLVGMLPTWAYTSTGEKYHKQAAATEAGKLYIPQIFERIADGESLATVAEWTRQESIGSGKISASTVRKIIRNRIYAGDRFFNLEGLPTVLKVEALVDADLWTRANQRLKNAPVGRRKPISGKSAILTSVLFCSRCPRNSKHAPMYRVRAWGGYFYHCKGHYPERKGCGNLIDLALTNRAVLTALRLAPDPWTEPRRILGENHHAELAQIKLEIRDLGARDLPDNEHDAELARLRAKRDHLESLPEIPDEVKEVEICGTCDGSEYQETCKTADHHKVTVGEHFTNLDEEGQRQMILDKVEVYAESAGLPYENMSHVPIFSIKSGLFKLPIQWIGEETASQAT